jgi:hypothetical protein
MLPAVRVELAGEQHIPSLVALHRSVLSDTLNARLGTRHLARLYREMMHSDISVVAVALSGDEVVGGTTATIDIHEQRRRMIRATPITEFPVLAINVAFHPGCISDLWEMLYRPRRCHHTRRERRTPAQRHRAGACQLRRGFLPVQELRLLSLRAAPDEPGVPTACSRPRRGRSVHVWPRHDLRPETGLSMLARFDDISLSVIMPTLNEGPNIARLITETAETITSPAGFSR